MPQQPLLLLLALSTATGFMVPAPTHGRMALRAAGCRQSLPTSTYTRKAPTSALRMQDGTPPEVDEAEMERRYRQQNSGTGYRKNKQDGLLFAMGTMILLIPFIAVGIAIGTGYIPLDYVR